MEELAWLLWDPLNGLLELRVEVRGRCVELLLYSYATAPGRPALALGVGCGRRDYLRADADLRHDYLELEAEGGDAIDSALDALESILARAHVLAEHRARY